MTAINLARTVEIYQQEPTFFGVFGNGSDYPGCAGFTELSSKSVNASISGNWAFADKTRITGEPECGCSGVSQKIRRFEIMKFASFKALHLDKSSG